uniref:Uncharacterized protein n=1 Tax=Plectus sambesii TaxID=2011161 RepID=A0A914VMV5_9BILA
MPPSLLVDIFVPVQHVANAHAVGSAKTNQPIAIFSCLGGSSKRAYDVFKSLSVPIDLRVEISKQEYHVMARCVVEFSLQVVVKCVLDRIICVVRWCIGLNDGYPSMLGLYASRYDSV